MVRSSLTRLLLLCPTAVGALLPFASGPEVCAQSGAAAVAGQTPQAKNQEELDRYLEITAEKEPHRVLQLSEGFAAAYPGSELLGRVYEAQMQACQELDDFAGVLLWGRRAVAALPADWATPLQLAEVIINHTGADGRAGMLEETTRDAREALARLEKTRPVREVAMQVWKEQKAAAESRAHEVLGLVAVQEGERVEAVRELETAVRLQPGPAGPQLFRLAVAYSLAGRNADARTTFNRAAEAGPAAVRVLAERELKRLATPGLAN